MVELLICICAFCVDGFFVAMSLRMERIKIDMLSILLIAFMNALFFSASVAFSTSFLQFLGISKYVSSLVYFGIGMYIYISYRMRNTPSKEDTLLASIQREVHVKEALWLGVLLSFDCLISGLVLVQTHVPLSLCFSLDLIASILALLLGTYCGGRMVQWKAFKSEVLASTVFVLLALLKLF